MSEEICCFKGCKNKIDIIYYGKLLCDKHWSEMSNKTPIETRRILGIKNEIDNSILHTQSAIP